MLAASLSVVARPGRREHPEMNPSTTDSPAPERLLALDSAAEALLFTKARTANTFADEPVSDAQLRAIVELAKSPPTAGNTNPLRILFVGTPAARERLVGHMSGANK